jgi:hypothetical protein
MSAKRPLLDLAALTAEHAAPMPEAAQRAAPPPVVVSRVTSITVGNTATENLEALAFKVSPAFRRRFRSRAVAADLKLNELLFEALDAWEEKRGLALQK